MIDWLSGWLKQIIVIILLATFVDLILPNSAMQRYVKVVVSLFILMTLLFPIIDLLKADFDLNRLTLSLEQLTDARHNDPAADSGENIQSLASIMKEGKQVQAENDKASLQMVEQQLAQTIMQQLEQRESVKADSVEVKTGLDRDGRPEIESVHVVLSSDRPHAERQHDEPQTQPVEPVKPVHIEIRIGQDEERGESAAKDDTAADERLTDEMEEKKRRILHSIQDQWRLSADQVSVIFDFERRR